MRRRLELESSHFLQCSRIEEADQSAAFVDHDQTAGTRWIVGVQECCDCRYGRSQNNKECTSLQSNAVHGGFPPLMLLFSCAFKIRTIAVIVFQFRVVMGTPNIFSISPR